MVKTAISALARLTHRGAVNADGKTGELLWGSNEDQPLDFASTTKIMTAYVVCQLAGKDSAVLDEVVTFSARADRTVGSTKTS